MMDPDLSRAKQLLPWELAFADWYANLPRSATIQEMIDAGQDFYDASQRGSSAPVEFTMQEKDLNSLRSRKAFKNHVKIARAGGYKAAKRLLKRHLPNGVAAHFRGLTLAEQANDYDGMVKYTTPLLREVSAANKKAGAQAAVQINITSKQAEMIETKQKPRITVEEMEVEVVEE